MADHILTKRISVKEGSFISMKVTPKQGCVRFNVNLQEGDGIQDVMLHFDCRFNYGVRPDVNTVVFNNCIGGQWQTENRLEMGSAFPFRHGAQAGLSITMDSMRFKVCVDHTDLFTMDIRSYDYLGRVNTMLVRADGDLDVADVIVN